ncbi:CHAD domain-containing protein [bacterium]|nr:CHAD domain-containing protein [bacterium]NBY18759.1 CHAD domain-containing protein [bacterium]
MPYTVSKSEPIESSLKTILVSGIKDAANVLSLSQGLHREQFKQARKSLKKARAVLYLLRDSISESKFSEEEKNLKKLSRTFRDVRDAHVTEEVFMAFSKAHQKELTQQEWAEIMQVLVSESKKTVEKVFQEQKKLKDAIGLLNAAMERIPEIKIKGSPWNSIEECLRSTFLECFEYSEVCQDTHEEECFVAWRKAVKFLRVELDFFIEALSPEIKKWNQELHTLSDTLGEYQDLTLIESQIQDCEQSIQSKKALHHLEKLLHERKKNLRKTARKLGREIFASKPKAFVRDFSQSTKSWFKAA